MFNDSPGIEVISFTPAHARQKCNTWMPTPAYNTYIVKAEASALGAYQEAFYITYRKRSQTWRLERKN